MVKAVRAAGGDSCRSRSGSLSVFSSLTLESSRGDVLAPNVDLVEADDGRIFFLLSSS